MSFLYRFFVKSAHTVTILSIVVCSVSFFLKKSNGRVFCKIFYLLRNNLMTRSKCILTAAVLLVDSTSIPTNCFLPLVKAGTLTSAQ